MERKRRLQVASRFGKSWQELVLVTVHRLVNGALLLHIRKGSPPKDSHHKIESQNSNIIKHLFTSF